jgi:hypothetical protein
MAGLDPLAFKAESYATYCRQSQESRLELGLRLSRGFSHTFNFFGAKRKPFTALKPKPGKKGGVQLV